VSGSETSVVFVMNEVNKLAPLCKVIAATYIAKTTKDTMKLRDDVKRVSDKFPYNNELRVRLKELQMKVKKMIKSDTKSDLDRKIHANGNRKNALWSTIKKLRSSEIKLPQDANFSADRINEHPSRRSYLTIQYICANKPKIFKDSSNSGPFRGRICKRLGKQ
jgi:hypothetical protein